MEKLLIFILLEHLLLFKGNKIMKKKKTEKVGTIKGIEILKNTRPIQDIPFRTGVHSDKRKKREKVNKNKLEKWL